MELANNLRVPLTPQVLSCRESEAGVHSLGEEVVGGRIGGVVEARGPRP